MVVRVLVFYVLLLFFTMLIGGTQQAIGFDPNISFAQFGPGLAALAMLVLFRKDKHSLNLSFKGIGGYDVLGAVAFPLGASLAILLLSRLLLKGGDESLVITAPLLLWMPFGAFGEELGWRGYLHPRLDRNVAGWLSCLIVGVLWMPFHMHLLQNGVVYVVFLTLLLVSYTVVLYVLMRRTNFNVWVAALFHLAINVTNLVYFQFMMQTGFMALSALVWGVLAAAIVFRRRELFWASAQ